MKVYLEQRRQAMLQLHLGDQQSYFLPRCALYKSFAVITNTGIVYNDENKTIIPEQ